MTAPELILGDCLESAAPLRGRGFRLVLTDPPYARAGAAHSGRTSENSDLALADVFWEHWFARCWGVVATACAPDACALVFTDYRTISALERAVRRSDTGWRLSQCAVWDRESVGLGSPMRASHELVAFLRAPDFRWDGPRDVPNVFRERWPYRAQEHHPSEKPVALLRRLAETFGRGGPVLDPFCGSGSTLAACSEAGITAVGVEVDPATCLRASERLGLRCRLLDPRAAVLRRAPDGSAWLLSRADKGWAEWGLPIRDEGDLLVRFGLRAVALGEDDHGPLVRVEEAVP